MTTGAAPGNIGARVAAWTFIVALLTSATLTAVFAVDARTAREARLRAEGRRVALSAVTLYDVLRLTGSAADRATLQAFLNAAVRGNSTESELAWAVVVDDKGSLVAGEVNERVLGAKQDPLSLATATTPPPSVVVVDAHVVARDSTRKVGDAPAGRISVGLSTLPAARATTRAVAIAGGISTVVALAFAGALFIFFRRRVVVSIAGAREESDALQNTLERHVGKRLAGELRDRAPGEGRRARVTALVVNIEGFTSRVSRDTPEQVVAFLQEVVGACVDVVEAHDGHVFRVLGETLVALWGVPDAHADDPTRAVDAALALQARCKELSEARRMRREETFTIGVGVATGDVVIAAVGNAGRRESVVIGEAVALAQRIEEEALATGFGVLVGEETFHTAQTKYEGAATPPILVRGWGVPLTLYRVRLRVG